MSGFFSFLMPVAPEEVEPAAGETEVNDDGEAPTLVPTAQPNPATNPIPVEDGWDGLARTPQIQPEEIVREGFSRDDLMDTDLPPLLPVNDSSDEDFEENDEQDLIDVEMIAEVLVDSPSREPEGAAQPTRPPLSSFHPLRWNRRPRVAEEDEDEAARPTTVRRTSRHATPGRVTADIPSATAPLTSTSDVTAEPPENAALPPFAQILPGLEERRAIPLAFYTAIIGPDGRIIPGQHNFPGGLPMPTLSPSPTPANQQGPPNTPGPTTQTNPNVNGRTLPPLRHLNLPGLGFNVPFPFPGLGANFLPTQPSDVHDGAPPPAVQMDFLQQILNRIISPSNGNNAGNNPNLPTPPNANGEPNTTANQSEPTRAAREEFAMNFARIMAMMRNFADSTAEKEDPERAKKLVAGLERVPEGLVRRLEQVGGFEGEERSAMCAVCWDNLLEREGLAFGESLDPAEHLSSGPGDSQQGSSSTEHSLPSQLSATAASDGSRSQPSAFPDPPPDAIVTLPCSHVFHASCLVPWFARPKPKTCPTCRFDIDPENLSYVYRSRRRAPAAQPTAMQAEGSGTQPGTQPDQQQQPATPVPITEFVTVTADAAQPGTNTLDPQGGDQPIRQLPDLRLGQAFEVNLGAFPFTIQIVLEAVPFNTTANNRGDDGNEPPPPPQQRLAAPPRLFPLATRTAATGGPGQQQQPTPQEGEPAVPGVPFFTQPIILPPPVPWNSRPRERRPRREWTLPAPPGPTLRQRVEKKEREAGWRCCDVSCGAGPSDEEPMAGERAKRQQVGIHGDEGKGACDHSFHPECLVSAERVAGYGAEAEDDRGVRVSCPVCRAAGCVSKAEWATGEQDLVDPCELCLSFRYNQD